MGKHTERLVALNVYNELQHALDTKSSDNSRPQPFQRQVIYTGLKQKPLFKAFDAPTDLGIEKAEQQIQFRKFLMFRDKYNFALRIPSKSHRR